MTAGYEALQGITKDYTKRVLQLERPQILFLGLFFIKGLQGVPRVYGVFEGVTGDYKELQGIISGDRALQRVTCRGYRGYERLQGITKDYRKLVL